MHNYIPAEGPEYECRLGVCMPGESRGVVMPLEATLAALVVVLLLVFASCSSPCHNSCQPFDDCKQQT
jgi:hypothetical protein